MLDWTPKGNYKKTGRSLIGLQKPKDEEIRKLEIKQPTTDALSADYYLERPNLTEEQKQKDYEIARQEPSSGINQIIQASRQKNFAEPYIQATPRTGIRKREADPILQSVIRTLSEPVTKLKEGGENIAKGKIGEGVVDILTGGLHGAMTPFTVPFGAIETGIKTATKDVNYQDPITGKRTNLGEEITSPINRLMNLPFDVIRGGSELVGKGLKEIGINPNKVSKAVGISPELDEKLNNLLIEIGGLYALKKGHQTATTYNKKQSPVPTTKTTPKLEQVEQPPRLLRDRFKTEQGLTETIPTEKPIDVSKLPIDKQKEYRQALERIKTRLTEGEKQNAEGIGSGLETPSTGEISTGQITPETGTILGGGEGRIRVRNVEKNRVEAVKPEEKIQSNKAEEIKQEIIPQAEQQTSDLPSLEEMRNVKQKEVQAPEKIGGNESAIQRMLSENKSPEDISKALNVPIEKVNKLIKKPIEDYEFTKEKINEGQAGFDLHRALNFPLGKSYKLTSDNSLVRIKEHTPNWSNFAEDLYENSDIKKVVNVTIGDLENVDFRKNKTSLDAIKEEFPNVKFIDIMIPEGTNYSEALTKINKELNMQEPIAQKPPKIEQGVQEVPKVENIEQKPLETQPIENIEQFGKTEQLPTKLSNIDYATVEKSLKDVQNLQKEPTGWKMFETQKGEKAFSLINPATKEYKTFNSYPEAQSYAIDNPLKPKEISQGEIITKNLVQSQGKPEAPTLKENRFQFRTDVNDKDYLEPIKNEDIVKTVKIGDRENIVHKTSMGSYQVTDVETGVSITNNSSGFRTVDGAIKKAKEMVAFAKPEFLQKKFGEYKQRVEMLEKSSTPSKDRIVEPTEATKPLAESTPVQGASVSKEPYEMMLYEYKREYLTNSQKVKDIQDQAQKWIDDNPSPKGTHEAGLSRGIEAIGKTKELHELQKQNRIEHKNIIEQALKEGKQVPEEVLKDYPDLAEKYNTTKEPLVKKSPETLTKTETKVEESISAVAELDKKLEQVERKVEGVEHQKVNEEIDTKFEKADNPTQPKIDEIANGYKDKLNERGKISLKDSQEMLSKSVDQIIDDLYLHQVEKNDYNFSKDEMIKMVKENKSFDFRFVDDVTMPDYKIVIDVPGDGTFRLNNPSLRTLVDLQKEIKQLTRKAPTDFTTTKPRLDAGYRTIENFESAKDAKTGLTEDLENAKSNLETAKKNNSKSLTELYQKEIDRLSKEVDDIPQNKSYWEGLTERKKEQERINAERLKRIELEDEVNVLFEKAKEDKYGYRTIKKDGLEYTTKDPDSIVEQVLSHQALMERMGVKVNNKKDLELLNTAESIKEDGYINIKDAIEDYNEQIRISTEDLKPYLRKDGIIKASLSRSDRNMVNRLERSIDNAKNMLDRIEDNGSRIDEFLGNVPKTKGGKQTGKRVVSQEKYEQAQKNIISKAGQLNAGLDPTMLKDLTIVGAYHFENGVKSFADYSQKMVEEFGEKVKPYLKDIWEEMKKEIPELKDVEKPKVIIQPEKPEGFVPEYGETKIRGAAKSTLAVGIENDIIKQVEDLPIYDVKKDAPQIKYVSDKITSDLPVVEKWISGEEPIPKDLNTGFIRRGVESYAVKTKNFDLFEKLIKSEPIAKAGTEAGREIRSFKHDEEYSGITSPYNAVKEVSKERGEQGGRAKELSNKYKSKIRDLETQLKLKDEQLKERETQRLIDQERKTTYRNRKAGRRRSVEVLEKEYDDLIKSFAKEMTMNVGFNPEQIVLISKMITNRVEKGMVKAVDVIDDVYISLKDKVEGLKKDDIIDAYLHGNKGRKPQTKNELSVSIADLRRQLETIKKIELLESGGQPFRRRFEKTEPSESLQQLKDNLKALEDKKRQELKEKNRPQKEIDDRVKQLQKQIDLVNSKIDGTYVKPEAKPKPQTPETIKKEKELADSRQQLKDNLKALGITEQQNLARSKELIKKRIDEYNEKINKGDYVKEDKTPAVDDEKRKLKSELEDVRKRWNDINKNLEGNITPEETKKIFDLFVKETELKKKMEESGDTGGKGKRTQEEWAYGQARVEYAHYIEELKNNINAITLKHLKEDPYGITKKFAKETPGMMKSIAATLDDSAVFNPGVRVLWNNPTIWARNSLKTFRDMYRVWGGKNVSAEIGAYVASSREFENALKDKVAVNVIEEAFPASQLLEKVPFLGSKLHKAADAAYTGWMFRNRMDLYEHFADVAQKNGYKDPTGLGIGKFINSLTGRGNLGKYEKAADVFNVWFFSPRRVKSHWDVLTAHAFDKEVSPFMKKQAAYSLLKIVGGTATVLTLAKAMGADVEIDPRSSDFGKIKIGNTRFDISGGMTSLIVLAARLAAYTTDKVGIADIASLKDSDGDLTKLGSGNWGDTTAWDKVLLFGTNKFSPAAAIIRDFLEGQTFGGEKFSFKNAILNSVTPLPIQNFEEILKDPNSAPLVAALIADGLGIFTNTYSNDPDLRKVKNALLGADTKFSKEKKINFNVALNRALRKGVITKDQADEYRKEFLELQKDAKLPEKQRKFRDRFNK